MTMENFPAARERRPRWQQLLARTNVLAGLLFIGVAAIGLAVSWNYAIGTATRMGTGYVPRLFLWILFGLGAVIFVMGLRERGEEEAPVPFDWRPVVFIPLALVVFAFTIERLGFLMGGFLTIIVAGFSSRDSRVVEVLISAVALVAFVWTIFIWGLGLTFPVWPGD